MIMLQVSTAIKTYQSSNFAVLESSHSSTNTEFLGRKCNFALSAAALTFETNSESKIYVLMFPDEYKWTFIFSPLWQGKQSKSSVPQTERSACKMPGFSSKNFLRGNVKKKKKKDFPMSWGNLSSFSCLGKIKGFSASWMYLCAQLGKLIWLLVMY